MRPWTVGTIDAAIKAYDDQMLMAAGTVIHPKAYDDLRRYAMQEALEAAVNRLEEKRDNE